jgi:hypothetical protein
VLKFRLIFILKSTDRSDESCDIQTLFCGFCDIELTTVNQFSAAIVNPRSVSASVNTYVSQMKTLRNFFSSQICSTQYVCVNQADDLLCLWLLELFRFLFDSPFQKKPA